MVKIVFICVYNSACSHVATVFANHYGNRKIDGDRA